MAMEVPADHWITSVIFEHSCKENFESVIKNVLEDNNLTSKLMLNSVNSEFQTAEKPKIKPVFLLISLLKKLHALESFTQKTGSSVSMLPVILELLESTYRQYSFTSLKHYFTLVSELKLLDLLNSIVDNSESSLVVQKLNQHFPRWTSSYRMALEKDFNIENSKVLDKVEESHTQCRRLILKLAVDKVHKAKYMMEQYPTDLKRLIKESKVYIMEAVTALESHAGPSVLEQMVSGDEMDFCNSDDLGVQLLLDYIQPKITDDVLLKFLGDLEPTFNSQPASALTSCLLPFDTMSEVSDEDSEHSDSEYESSEDITDSLKSFPDILPTATSSKTSEMTTDHDENDFDV